MNTVVSEHPEAVVFMDYRHSALRASAGNDGEYSTQSNFNLL
jgi:hypothetical protein